MTKLFIAGHSDSGDAYLPEGTVPWPERTRAWLEERTGSPCEVVAVRFAPIGERAVEYLIGAIEKAGPDIVILPFGGYVFSIGTVAKNVGARFGPRAERWFLRTEGSFQARTGKRRLGRNVNRRGRWAARKILGTRTMATVPQTMVIYTEILQRLAQKESLQVLAVRDARFSAETQAREPGLHGKFDRMEAVLLPIVEQHHFALADLEGALQRAPDRRVFHQDDGVHTTAAFHEVYFGVMQEALAPLLPRLRED